MFTNDNMDRLMDVAQNEISSGGIINYLPFFELTPSWEVYVLKSID